MAKIVVIGAGLTGISTAYHLEQKGFYDYKLFEKESCIGGLCRSVVQDGFTFDYTGHLLHASDSYFRSLIESTVGLDNLHAIYRRSFIYSQNTYTQYPYQINLQGLPTTTIAECIQGFIERKQSNKQPKTFYDWVLQNFGVGFGKHFFFTYQKKIFAYPVRSLTASWTGRFVPATSLEQIIDGVLGKGPDQHIGYNSQFFYPKEGGIIAWVTKFAQHLFNPVYTNFCVSSIDVTQKVVHFTNGHVEPYEQLITTMPLDQLLCILKEPADSQLQKAHDKLLCNSVVNFNLGIKRFDLSDKHWIYFPEPIYPFYRIGFPHNFAPAMVPQGCSSLYGEFAYIKKSKRTINEYLRVALAGTKKLLNIQEKDLATECIIHIPHAYVIYDFWREKELPKLLKKLAAYQIFSVGRYGEWKYSSMQEAVLDGKKIAEQLLFIPAITTNFTDYKSYTHIPKEHST
jgi:protoporphyrinogen oxidase